MQMPTQMSIDYQIHSILVLFRSGNIHVPVRIWCPYSYLLQTQKVLVGSLLYLMV